MSAGREQLHGFAYWLVVFAWFRVQSQILIMTKLDAIAKIRARFTVSRATAYRYLNAWAEAEAIRKAGNKGSA